jgi:hypothetical protein
VKSLERCLDPSHIGSVHEEGQIGRGVEPWVSGSPKTIGKWIGLRENLQEIIDFPMKYIGFPVNFPFNQSIE